jgi:predicted Zn-dependent protease
MIPTWLALCAWATLLSGCVFIPPVTAADAVKLAADGAQIRKQILRVHRRAEAPALQAYVQRLGARVAQDLDPDAGTYSFEVVVADVVNAFALPGNHVFVTTGAVLAMRTEAQLVNVLGHEVAHVVGDHGWQNVQFRQQNARLHRVDPEAGLLDVLWTSFLHAATNGQFSQGLESASDRAGLDAAYALGYDPRGLQEFLALADRASTVKRDKLSEWIGTHPPSAKRSSDIAAHIAARGMQLKGLRQGAAELLQVKRNAFPMRALE